MRLIVDVAMGLLLLLSMCYEMVGPAFARLLERTTGIVIDGWALGPVAHEVVGATFLALLLVHLWLNRRWLMNVFKGTYSASRVLLTLLDVLLIADVLLLLVSSVMLSRVLALPLVRGMGAARTAHMLSAYWGFVIMSVHVGVHWRRIPPWMALPMAWGAWAFVERKLFDYMSLRSLFVFFDFEEPIWRFLLDYVAMMILFAGLGRGLMALCQRLGR